MFGLPEQNARAEIPPKRTEVTLRAIASPLFYNVTPINASAVWVIIISMADDDGQVERPEAKDDRITIRVPPEWKRDAERRARRARRSLLDVIRSYVFGYGMGEFPEPPLLPGEGKRAKKRSRKKQPPSDE
jgi:hypothetical protein